MNNAPLYNEANYCQRRDAKEIIDKFGHLIQWRSDGKDTLLDIGSGTGDVTIDFILPRMPQNFEKLVGVDISEEMVRYSRLHHQSSKISFEKLNIAGEISEFLMNHPERFNHITSFYTLHWEHNQKQAVTNIHDLLNNDGDCFLINLAKHSIFDAYKMQSKNNKWSSCMKNVDLLTTPFQYIENVAEVYSELLRSVGFSRYDVRVVAKTYTYDGLASVKRNMGAVNPFVENMNLEEKNDYLEDLAQTLIEMGIGKKKDSINDYSFTMQYKLMIVYARK